VGWGTAAVSQGPRYAIFYVPPADSELFRFGSAVLGYDCYLGRTVARPVELAREPDRWENLTTEPHRYGFHATLKAPFYLKPACTEAQLVSALNSFAGLGHAVPSFMPKLEMLSGFAAVVPEAVSADLNALADNCATIFDAFRAPMAAEERARRLASGLNHSQIQNLDRWGYPYLFSDFRFHMTLTGKVDADQRDEVLDVLRRAFRPVKRGTSFPIERISLVRQDSVAHSFRVIDQATLRLGL
jgi:Protein of unknown function (DUF1045)